MNEIKNIKIDLNEKENKPINWNCLMEDFVRLENPKSVKQLVKQLSIDGEETPRITFQLNKMLNNEHFEPLINKFRNTPEDFLDDFIEVLKNAAKFEDNRIEDYILKDNKANKQIHVIPDYKDTEWLIPLRENFTGDLTKDEQRIFRFKGRFMSLGLERVVEFEKMMWECLVCGTEFETIPYYRKTREKYKVPNFCTNKRCKAKGKSDFMLLSGKSTKFEKRTFNIIDVENKEVINEIRCYISKNIDYFSEKAKNIRCNDEIEVLGILKMDTADIFSSKEEQELSYYIEVIDINTGKTNEVDPKIIKQIKRELKKDPFYCNKIFDSIHPYSQNILNFFLIKLCFGAAFITSDSYTNIRNGINTICAGHSGTLKSKIASDFKKILGANNFGIIFGKNTTAKGLVPVAQRNNQEKNLVKRYGAIAYYNKKTFVIDEAQYLYKKDTDALECFKYYEDGVISRALDGTTINAPAEGTVNFALNYQTEDESYDFSKSLEENLGFPEDQKSILDRFDLHFRIPRNTDKIVEILVNRGDDSYKPKFQLSNEIIFNYFIEAKRIYSNGVKIPKDILEIIKVMYNLIIEKKREKQKNYILNPREAEILKKVLKTIAAIRLRDEVKLEDLEFLKKYLINTIIPFQDNPYVIQNRIIDVQEIFFNVFELLMEIHEDFFYISEFIKFLREYLRSNYFEEHYYGINMPTLDNFIDEEDNLTNNKFRKLLDENKEIIESYGYIVDRFNNKTSFMNKKWINRIIKEAILEIYENNNTNLLELKDIVDILELNTSFSKELIIENIDLMIKDKLVRIIQKTKLKLR